MLDLYLAAINSDRCPDSVAAIAVLGPILAALVAVIAVVVVITTPA